MRGTIALAVKREAGCMKKLALLAVVAIVLVGCSSEPEVVVVTATLEPATATPIPSTDTPEPTATLEPDYLAEYMDWFVEIFANRWEDAFSIASSTPYANLSTPVAELQALRREAQAISSPDPRVQAAHGVLIEALDGAIETFLELLARPDRNFGLPFTSYIDKMDQFSELIFSLADEQ